MEVQHMQEKPKVKYAEYVAQRPELQKGTLANLINRYIVEMDGTPDRPGPKPVGESHRCTLRKICRLPIAAKVATDLKKMDFIRLAEALRAEGLKPATANQYFTYIATVLKYAPSAWDEHEKVDVKPLTDAKPFLSKNGYLGKSEPRERRPSPDEIDRLVAFFAKQNEHWQNEIDMVKVTLWQLRSGRRIGESCALLWEDWNREDHTILVRKMKDPKNKNKRKVVALPKAAQALLEEWWETRDPNEPRILPFAKKSCIKRYVEAKRLLGIVNLRLHDSRRDCGTRLVEDDGYSPSQAILVTGHETVAIFERTYLKQDPAKFKDGPRASTR